MTGFSKAD